MERDFKGIWIPKNIWLSKDLTLQEKVFLVEILSLDNENGCFATNGYFAEFFGVGINRVSIIINSLVTKGYITSQMIHKDINKGFTKRVLRERNRPILGKSDTPYSEESIPPTRKQVDPILGKCVYNNTVNNTISNTSNKREKSLVFIESLEISENLKNSLIKFYNYRKQAKKPWTQISIEENLNDIGKVFKNENDFIDAINHSIKRGYQGIFADNKSTYKTKPTKKDEYVPTVYKKSETTKLAEEGFDWMPK